MWRNAAQSRYFVQAVCVIGFAAVCQIYLADHMTRAIEMKGNHALIMETLGIPPEGPGYGLKGVVDPALYTSNPEAEFWAVRIEEFYASTNIFILLFYGQWMFVFQQFYMAMYAGRNKRVMKYFQFENVLDTVMLFVGMAYLIILLRDYRYNTFLADRTYRDDAILFFYQYTDSPVKE